MADGPPIQSSTDALDTATPISLLDLGQCIYIYQADGDPASQLSIDALNTTTPYI